MKSLQNNIRIDCNENDLEQAAQCYEIINRLPCACYLVKDDPGFTVIYGNPHFYELFGCTKEELQHKYDDSLRALFYTESLSTLDSMRKGKEETVFQCRQHIMKELSDAWIDTEAVRFENKEGLVFCCVSYDITKSCKRLRVLEQYEKEVRMAAEQVKFDIFKYNCESGKLWIYNACNFLTSRLLGERPEGKNLPELFTDKGLIHPDYRKEFQSAYTAVLKGESKIVCELRMKNDADQFAWVKMILMQDQENQGQEPYVLGILENITEQKELSVQYLNETQFYQAMLAEKAAFSQVNVTLNRCTRFGGMWNLYNEVIDTLKYSELIEEFINKVVHPEDRKHYLEIMQRDNFIRSLDNGIDKLGCEFRRIVEQNKMMWMELRVHLFREPITHHV